MPDNPLIFTRFKKWQLESPISTPLSGTRIMVGSPQGYEEGKRYMLSRSEVSGKPWWLVINENPGELMVVAEFQPTEKYIYQPSIEPIRVEIPNSPSNYVDGEIYLVPESEATSNPYWNPV